LAFLGIFSIFIGNQPIEMGFSLPLDYTHSRDKGTYPRVEFISGSWGAVSGKAFFSLGQAGGWGMMDRNECDWLA
jgi:hypothetical protein